MRSIGIGIGAVVAVALAQAAPAAGPARLAQSEAARTVDFRIPSSPMSQALTALGAQSGLTIIVETRISRGLQAPGLSGQYTPDEALRRLLEPAGLKAEYLDSKTVAIRLAGDGDFNGFTTSQAGYEGSLIPVRRGEAGSQAPPLRIAQADPASPPARESSVSEPLEEVVVTGSTLKTATVGEIERGAMPIDIVTRAQIERNPGESLARILKKQPYFSGANENPANIASADGDLPRSTLNLRGMGSKYTQVVVNGRRFSSDTRPADLGALPTEAIDSTLILTGGASSIYGPNAVAGVVDIRLRKEFEGFQLSSEYGRTTKADGTNTRYSALFGTHTDRFRIVASAQYLDGDGFREQDRAFTANQDLSAWGGHDWRSPFSSLPGLYAEVDDPEGNYLVLDRTRVQPGQTAASEADFQAFDPAGAPGTHYGWVEEPSVRKSAHFVTEYDFAGDGLQAYAMGFYDEYKVGPVPKFYEWMFPEGDGILVPAANYYNPFGRDVLVKYYRFAPSEHLGNRAGGVNETAHGTAGLRGAIGRYRYDIGANFHRSTSDIRTTFFAWAADALVESLSRPDGSGVNLFGNNANRFDQIVSLRDCEIVLNREEMKSIDAKISGPLARLPGGDLQGSLVVERRDGDSFWQNNGGNYGWVNEPGYNGANVNRKVNAYAGELLAPVYRNDAENAFLALVELGAGTRYEDFEDSGTQYEWPTCPTLPCESTLIGDGKSTFNTQISQFTALFGLLDDTLRVRAAYGGGFVSPTPLEQLSPAEIVTEVDFDPVTGAEIPIRMLTGGNLDLEAEKATNITWGFTWNPRSLRGLNVNVDVWEVEIENRIAEPDLLQVLLGVSDVGSVTRDPETGAVEVDLRFHNGGTYTLAGIDTGLQYAWETAGGHEFASHLNVTYTRKGQIAERQVLGRFNFGDTLPRVLGAAGVEWRRGKWGVAFDMQYRGGVWLPEYDPDAEDYTANLVEKTSDYLVGNLYASYDFGDDPRFARGFLSKASAWIGIEDLWDEEVPFIDLFGQGYDSNSSNIRGRYVYCGFRLGF